MAEDRVVDGAGMRQSAGMRGGSAPSGIRSADLGDNQRLAGLRRLPGYGAETVGAADPLEIDEEDVGAARVEPPIHVVVRFKDRLVAGADLVGEAQLSGTAAAQKRESQRAALGADRDRPRLGRRREQALP